MGYRKYCHNSRNVVGAVTQQTCNVQTFVICYAPCNARTPSCLNQTPEQTLIRMENPPELSKCTLICLDAKLESPRSFEKRNPK